MNEPSMKMDEYANIADSLYKTLKVDVVEDGESKYYKLKCAAKPITKKADEEITDARKTFKMAGFREGNVPISIVRKRVGPDILKSVISRVIDNVVRNLLEEKDIVPAMQPEVHIENFEPNEKFDTEDDAQGILSFSVKIDVLPDSPEINWQDVKLSLIKINPVQSDIDKAHKDILENFKNFTTSDSESDTVEQGDSVLIDYEGYVNDNSFNGSEAEDVRQTVGGQEMIPGFSENLVGMKVGESKDFTISLPFNYLDNKVASKEAEFTVTVKEIAKPEGVDEINEEFVKAMGMSNMEEFEELVVSKIESDYSVLARLYNKKLLLDHLDQHYDIRVPESMLNADLEATTTQMMEVMKDSPEVAGKSKAELMREFRQLARRRVKTGIIFAQIAKAEGIQVTEEDLKDAEAIQKMQSPGQEELIEEMYKDDSAKMRLIGPLLEEKVVDHIINNMLTNVDELEVTSDQFMEKYAPQMTEMIPGLSAEGENKSFDVEKFEDDAEYEDDDEDAEDEKN